MIFFHFVFKKYIAYFDTFIQYKKIQIL